VFGAAGVSTDGVVGLAIADSTSFVRIAMELMMS
jgi:hypothetical protein